MREWQHDKQRDQMSQRRLALVRKLEARAKPSRATAPDTVHHDTSAKLYDLPRFPWLVILLTLLFTIALVYQVEHAGQRHVKLLVALIFFIILIKYRLYVGVAVFLFLYPIPAAVTIANTNFIFAIFLLVLWLIKAGLHKELGPHRSYLDGAVAAYLMAHVLSFASIETAESLQKNIFMMQFYAASVALYFLMVNHLTDERRLRIATEFVSASTFLIYASAILEITLPSVRLIPHWFLVTPGVSARFGEEGGRVGGILGVHSLLADSCAMNFILQLFLATKSKHRLLRLYHFVLGGSSVAVISLTVNRGGIIALVLGAIYFAYLCRKDINPRRLAIAVAGALVFVALGEWIVRGVEDYQSIFVRLVATHFKRGIPDTRIGVWSYVVERIQESPIIGHGPYYDVFDKTGMPSMWPHNCYLFYLHSAGIIGLLAFLWVLMKAFLKSFPGRDGTVLRDTFARGLMAVCHVQILQFAFVQLRTSHQRGNVYIYLMWSIFAFSVCARMLWDRRRKEAEKELMAAPVSGSAAARKWGGAVARVVPRAVPPTAPFSSPRPGHPRTPDR